MVSSSKNESFDDAVAKTRGNFEKKLAKDDEAESHQNFSWSAKVQGAFNPAAIEERPSLQLLSRGLERVHRENERISEDVESIKKSLEQIMEAIKHHKVA